MKLCMYVCQWLCVCSWCTVYLRANSKSERGCMKLKSCMFVSERVRVKGSVWSWYVCEWQCVWSWCTVYLWANSDSGRECTKLKSCMFVSEWVREQWKGVCEGDSVCEAYVLYECMSEQWDWIYSTPASHSLSLTYILTYMHTCIHTYSVSVFAFDRCCFYCFVINSLVALLEALCAPWFFTHTVTHIHTFIHIYIHTHTYIHTYIHT